MSTLTITLTFLEPYRIIDWVEDSKRTKEERYLRGQSFAQWHKVNNKDEGTPYITGTLLRSAAIKAAEELLGLSNGKWNGVKCCNGFFNTTKEKGLQPKFKRKRHTTEWESNKECTTKEDACPYCIISGRKFDGKDNKFEKDKNGPPTKENYPLHFSNLSLLNWKTFKSISDIATERTLNRVDSPTGKAQDYFKIYEVDDETYWTFKAVITVTNEKEIEILKDFLRYVDRLCGALCKIEIFSEGENDSSKHELSLQQNPEEVATEDKNNKPVNSKLSEEHKKLEEAAFLIIRAFDLQGKIDKIRILADAVRSLRLKKFNVHNIDTELPSGKDGRDHHLWDIKINGKKLRSVLKKLMPEEKKLLRKFYEDFGQVLYEQLKKYQGETTETFRALGESEYYSQQNLSDLSIPTMMENTVREFILVGTLKSETPFYIGVNSEDGEQTSSQILLTKDGHYRIPRSVLRGILRRDLRLAFDTGCEVKLGQDTPCDCKVCQVMRKITLKDTKSSYCEPPEILNRIRMNPYTSTVDEGALFDMEVGPEGLEFNFVLRFRGEFLPKELKSVLKYWSDGIMWLGGSGSTGKGRFSLQNLKVFEWNLSGDGLNKYINDYGMRGKEEEITHNDFVKAVVDIKQWDKLEPYISYLKPRWQKIVYEIEFKSPLLTADPIAALIDEENRDSIAFRKRKATGRNEFEYIAAVKGETIRGITRNSVGKRTGDLEKDHEDCTCSLCSIFGNEHEISKIRFEDLTPVGECSNKHIDHVAIDRYHGGAEDKMKFDTFPLAASPNKPLKLIGIIWIRNDIDDTDKIKTALAELKYGLHPIGGKAGTGYGWVSDLTITEADITFELHSPVELQTVEKTPYDFSRVPKPDVKIKDDEIYYPHYFLKPGSEVNRKPEVTGHQKWDKEKVSGKITCKLTTLSPLIIPDTVKLKNENGIIQDENGYTEDSNGHKTYKFFRIKGEELITGSELRGMIENVYEALTNSCFRIIDESKYLSWRMKPEEFAGGYKAGRVIKEDGQLKIVEANSIRLPLYDDENLINDIINPTSEILNQRNGHNRWENALSANKIIAAAAVNNKNYLKEHPDKLEILKGKKKIKFYEKIVFQIENRRTGLITIIDKVAILNDQGQYEGYIKFTGPNNAEVENNGNMDDDIDDNWNPMDLNISLSTSYKLKASKNQFYPRPFLQFIKDGKEYTVTKRCERIFVMRNNGRKYAVTKLAEEQYNVIRKTYEENKKELADQFATIINNDLAEGDLVYFLPGSDNNVKAIIHVCISRKSSKIPLGKKLSDNLRPCEREWIEDFEMHKELEDDPIRKYFLRHEEGYCPACRLFGTTYYKGRVRFGFAHLLNKPKWLNEGKPVTLPLLEKPRPTWSIPDDTFNIPGRKFYLHHNGWEKVINSSIDKTKNNRSVETLNKGSEFQFEIFFENLENEELGLLLYCLELEPGLAHKLGMGKPLGFGSVEIKVDNLQLFNVKDKQSVLQSKAEIIRIGLGSLDVHGTSWYELSHINHLRKLLYFSKESPKVKYPKLNKNDEADEAIKAYTYETLRDQEKQDRVKKLQTPWTPIAKINKQF